MQKLNGWREHGYPRGYGCNKCNPTISVLPCLDMTMKISCDNCPVPNDVCDEFRDCPRKAAKAIASYIKKPQSTLYKKLQKRKK